MLTQVNGRAGRGEEDRGLPVWDILTSLWHGLLFRPSLNGLMLLYTLAWENLGLTIIVAWTRPGKRPEP